jgi:hypothetical protein
MITANSAIARHQGPSTSTVSNDEPGEHEHAILARSFGDPVIDFLGWLGLIARRRDGSSRNIPAFVT